MNMTSSPATSLDDVDASVVSATDLQVFLAYENLAAALRASDTLAALSRRSSEGLAVKLSPWSFATLAQPLWRAQAAPYVERAHLILIATCSAVPSLSATIEGWLQSCLAQPREDRLAVAALFHHRDGADGPESPRLRSVQRIAREAGCAFFAPGVTGEFASLV